MLKSIVALVAVTVPLVSCVSESRYNRLEEENSDLRGELEEVTFGPERRYLSASAALEAGQFTEAITIAEDLITRHPGSSEAVLAEKLVADATKARSDHEAAELEAKRRADQERDRAQRRLWATQDQALASLRRNHDDIQQITWYRDRASPQSRGERTALFLYIGRDDARRSWLRLRIQYKDTRWLFLESFTIKADDKRFPIKPSRSEIERDNSGGSIWEWYAVSPDSRLQGILRTIANAKNVVIRFEGDQRIHDFTMNSRDKRALLNVLSAYEALNR